MGCCHIQELVTDSISGTTPQASILPKTVQTHLQRSIIIFLPSHHKLKVCSNLDEIRVINSESQEYLILFLFIIINLRVFNPQLSFPNLITNFGLFPICAQ